jgi:hypothetical protein
MPAKEFDDHRRRPVKAPVHSSTAQLRLRRGVFAQVSSMPKCVTVNTLTSIILCAGIKLPCPRRKAVVRQHRTVRSAEHSCLKALEVSSMLGLSKPISSMLGP